MSDEVDQAQNEVDATVQNGIAAAAVAVEEEKAAEANAAPQAPGESKADADFRRRMDEATIDLRECAIAVSRFDTALKSSKVAYKAAIETINRLSARGPEALPLFDSVPGAAEAVANSPEIPDGSKSEDDDEWRLLAIDENLVLPKSLFEKLRDKLEIITLGDLCDFLGGKIAKYPHGWGSAKGCGIGPANATKIEDAMEAFWTERNARLNAPPAAETEAEPPAGYILPMDWEDGTIADLSAYGLTKQVADHLERANLLTVGAIEEFHQSHPYSAIDTMGEVCGDELAFVISKFLEAVEDAELDAENAEVPETAGAA